GRDVVVHPRAGVAYRRKRPAALAFVVVVEADRIGLAPALGDTRPRGLFRPWSSHLPPLAGGLRPQALSASRIECDPGCRSISGPVTHRSRRWRSAVLLRGSRCPDRPRHTLCRENAPGGPVLTMHVLYLLSYVGTDRILPP